MKKQLLVAAVLAATASLQAQAGAMDDGNLTIGGFGTLGAARSNLDEGQFARYNQAEGVGDKARIGLDSNLGLQASYKINDWLSATAQVLTRKNTSPTFTTDLTWAFLKARINDETSVRVGRVVMPIFLISDYQNVGYANTMMRPPIEMYAQAPVENVDGVDLTYQRAFGDLNLTTVAFVGTSRGKLFVPTAGGSVATYRAPAMGLTLTGEYGPFMARVSHARADLTSNDVAPINALTNTLKTVGFTQLANDITLVSGKKVAFTSVGATMDWNNIVVQAEYAQRRAKEAVYIPDTNAWYTMVGYRIGKFLPYYSHAAYKGAGRSITLPGNFPKTGVLAATVNGVMTSAEQSSDLIGMRWDFAKSLALKVQVDRIKPGAKSGALIFAPAAGIKKNVTVVGAALDFVF
ncbi:porin [Duganella sp. BuS-21]|uniref:porin n=1 Tax=Duganella sp. BuS-21 TaxID=2943848 RepID=UPI0035A679FB